MPNNLDDPRLFEGVGDSKATETQQPEQQSKPSLDDPRLFDGVKNNNPLQTASDTVKDSQPATARKVIPISKDTGLHPDFVADNLNQMVDAKQTPTPQSLKNIQDNYPATTKWHSDPNNMAMGKDDLQNSVDTEKHIQNHSLLSQVGDAISGTSDVMGKMLMEDVPNALVSSVAGASKMVNQLPGLVNPEWRNNPLAQASAQAEQQFKTSISDTDVNDAIKNGDIEKAVRGLVAHTAQGAVPLATAAVATEAGLPEVGAGYFGLQSGNETYNEALDRGATQSRALEAGGLNGALTGLTMSVPIHYYESQFQNIIKLTGQDNALKMAYRVGSQLATSVVGLKSVNAVQMYGDAFAKRVTGDQNAFDGLTDKLKDEIDDPDSTFQGALFALPGAVHGELTKETTPDVKKAVTFLKDNSDPKTGQPTDRAGVKDLFRQQGRAEINQQHYIDLEKTATESKLQAEAPKVHADRTQEQMKVQSSETIHIPVEQFIQTLNQSGLNPEEEAKKLGIEDSLRDAQDHGGTVQIPTSKWVSEKAGTPEYKAMAPHVKFDGTEKTMQEVEDAKKVRQDIDAQMPKLVDEAKGLIQKKINEVDTKKKGIEKAGLIKGVVNKVKEALTGTKLVDQSDAKDLAELHARMIHVIAEKISKSPEEVPSNFNKILNDYHFGWFNEDKGNESDKNYVHSHLDFLNKSGHLVIEGKGERDTPIRNGQIGDAKGSGLNFVVKEGDKYFIVRKDGKYVKAKSGMKFYEANTDLAHSLYESEKDGTLPRSSLTNETESKQNHNPDMSGTDDLYRYVEETRSKSEGYNDKRLMQGPLSQGSMFDYNEKPKSKAEQEFPDTFVKPMDKAVDQDMFPTAHGKKDEEKPQMTLFQGATDPAFGLPMHQSFDAYNVDKFTQLLKTQREKEGLKAVVYNPKTGEMYGGSSHLDALKKTPEKTRGQFTEGFMKPDGSFITRAEGEKQYNVKMSADLKYAQGEGQGNRGHIDIIGEPGKRTFNIYVNQGSDKSTFFHEPAHAFLYIMKDLADKTGNKELNDDLKTYYDWVGVKSFEDLTTEHLEQFARGFEYRLWEGNIPVIKMNSMFNRFAEWMRRVYSSSEIMEKYLGIKMTGDMRGVYDRMLASTDEIAKAKQTSGYDESIPPEMPEGMKAKLMEVQGEANSEAMNKTVKPMMAELTEQTKDQIRQTENIAHEIAQRQAKEIPSIGFISSQHAFEEKYQTSVRSICSDIANGKEAMKGMEIDKADLIKLSKSLVEYAEKNGFGDDLVKAASSIADSPDEQEVYAKIRSKLMEKFKPIEGTPKAEEIALDAVHTEKTLEAKAIKDQALNKIEKDKATEKAKNEAEKEPKHITPEQAKKQTDAEEKAKAEEAKNPDKVTIAEGEIKDTSAAKQVPLMAKPVRGAVPPKDSTVSPAFKDYQERLQYARGKAKQILDGKSWREAMDHQTYYKLERDAVIKATEAKDSGNPDKADRYRTQALINHALALEAQSVRKTVREAMKNFDNYQKADKTISKSRDIGMIEAGRGILAHYGIGKKTGTNPIEHLAQFGENPVEKDTYESMKDMVNSVMSLKSDNFGSMSYGDLKQVHEATEALWDFSKELKQFEINGQKQHIQEVIDKLRAQNKANTKPRTGAPTHTPTKIERGAIDLMGFHSSLRIVDSWADLQDTTKEKVYTNAFVQKMRDATQAFRMAQEGANKEYTEIVKSFAPLLKRDKIHSPELNHTFDGTKEIMGMLQHIGNHSNLQKLIRGREWGDWIRDGNGEIRLDKDGRKMVDTSKLDAFIKRMVDEKVITKAHMDAVQKMWDFHSSLLPESQKVYKRLNGRKFAEQENRDIHLPFGSYKGGYVPAKIDPYTDVNGHGITARQQAELNGQYNSDIFPTTGSGFTKARQEEYAGPLKMDITLTRQHMDEALRYIHLEPTIRELSRVITNRDFRESMGKVDRHAVPNMLMPWLSRSARQRIGIPGNNATVDAVSRYLRQQTTYLMLAGNMTDTLSRTMSVPMAGVKVPLNHLNNALWSYMSDPKKVTATNRQESPMMYTRHGYVGGSETGREIDKLLNNPGVFTRANDFIKAHGYALQTTIHQIMDNIVYNGAKNHALSELKLSEPEAIKHAERTVIATMGSNNPEDVSAVHDVGPYQQAALMFFGWFNRQYNLQLTETQKAIRGNTSEPALDKTFEKMGIPKRVARLGTVAVLTAIAPSLVFSTMHNLMAGKGVMGAGQGGLNAQDLAGFNDDDGFTGDFMKWFFGSPIESETMMVPYVGPFLKTAMDEAMGKKSYSDMGTSPIAETLIKSYKTVKGGVKSLMSDDENDKTRQRTRDIMSAIQMLGINVAPAIRPISYMAGQSQDEYEPDNAGDELRGVVSGMPGPSQ